MGIDSIESLPVSISIAIHCEERWWCEEKGIYTQLQKKRDIYMKILHATPPEMQDVYDLQQIAL